MADDILNEGAEEEAKGSSDNQSDDDFGLPDLEFDDLQELDMGGDDSEDSLSDEVSASSDSQEFDMSLVEGLTSEESDLGSGLQDGDLDPPESPESVLDEGIDEVEDVLDSAQLISDRLGDEDGEDSEKVSDLLDSDNSGFNYDDLLGSSDTDSNDSSNNLLSDADDTFSEKMASTDDLFADIDSPDDLAALGFADEEGAEEPAESVTETSDSLFASDHVSSSLESGDSLFGSDSLALESEEKVDFEASSDDGSLPPNYKSYTYEESSGGFTKIVVIGLVGIAVVAAGLLYFSNKNKGEEIATQKVEKVIPKKKPVAKPKATDTKKQPVAETEKEKKKVSSEKVAVTNSKPKVKPKPEAIVTASAADPGEIVRVAQRTSLSYVIVGSFVDEDMAMDYASELSNSGKGVKIIEPYGKSKRFRVSVADFPSYGDAASQLDGFKPEYGDDVWALKY
ncbi:MAG: hypothetical protein AAF391_12430 [Bacteroidota bacterium]